MTHKDLRRYHFKSYVEFEDWLDENWQQPESIWLMFAKKDSGQTSITYEEAREVALRYGWIDGLINKWDDRFYLIKFSKRRRRSTWSKINRDIVEELIEQGRMHENGLGEVKKAKADGRWDAAYLPPSEMTIPDWFIKRVNTNPQAKETLESMTKAQRYTIAYNLRTGKKQETIDRRADKFFDKLKKGEKQ